MCPYTVFLFDCFLFVYPLHCMTFMYCIFIHFIQLLAASVFIKFSVNVYKQPNHYIKDLTKVVLARGRCYACTNKDVIQCILAPPFADVGKYFTPGSAVTSL